MAKNAIKNEGALDNTNRLIINHNFSDVSLCTTQLDVTSSTTLANVTGMVTESLVPGETYKFRAVIPTVCTANNGSKFAFKFGTASMLASIEYEAKAYTASAVAVTRGTTATDQALLCDNASAVVILVEIEGTLIMDNTAALLAAHALKNNTLQLQAAEHTSHSDTFSVFKKARMQFEHITTG
jgi:hypothetical protein